MKRTRSWYSLAVVCSLAVFWTASAYAITVTGTLDANTLKNSLFFGGGAGIDLSTVVLTVSGHTISLPPPGDYYVDGGGGPSAGTYTNPIGGTYGLPPVGIVISSGAVGDYGDGPDTLISFSTGYGPSATNYGDPATPAQESILDPITGGPWNHYDVTQIDVSFDMLPGYSDVYFNVTFGSEEYPEWVGSQFNDGFGLLVNGTNIAFVDGSPVNINHPDFLATAGTELDGVLNDGNYSTYVHTFTSPVNAAGNTLTFIVADTSDGVYDTTAYIAQLGGSPPPPPVPEPASALVWSLLAGLGITFGRLRGKRKAA